MVDLLGSQACAWVDEMAAARGVQTTIPLSPGLQGWAVRQGQSQLFATLDAAAIGVHLNDGSMMVPHKSTSMLIGLGRDVRHVGDACDYCSMSATCRHRDEHRRLA